MPGTARYDFGKPAARRLRVFFSSAKPRGSLNMFGRYGKIFYFCLANSLNNVYSYKKRKNEKVLISVKDSGIGTATVYRMINILEEIGALSRKNMYKIACGPECEVKDACVIEFDDDTIIELSGKSWNQVVQLGLRACGYSSGHKIKSVTAKSCEFSR